MLAPNMRACSNTVKHYLDRVAYMARAVRLGVNVLLLDTDLIVFHNPYPWLKGVMGDYNYLVMRDGTGWVGGWVGM